MEKELKQIEEELTFLKRHPVNSIMISTTAKHSPSFRVLPRRIVSGIATSSFMVNDEGLFKDILSFFDGEVDIIYVDVEQKQIINLFAIAQLQVKNSKLISVKPNDTTLEAADLLIRNQLNENLCNKLVIVIGTGNLASKVAVRLAERQARVYVIGRSHEKEEQFIKGINFFLPKYSPRVETFDSLNIAEQADIIISFLSGAFSNEYQLTPFIEKKTFIIDGGINNFGKSFVKKMVDRKINIVRLDTRIALPYQQLSNQRYTQSFFNEVLGKKYIQGVQIVSGGFIGPKGSIIVDSIKKPTQVIGIADGEGGVKQNEQYSKSDRYRIEKIKQAISKSLQKND